MWWNKDPVSLSAKWDDDYLSIFFLSVGTLIALIGISTNFSNNLDFMILGVSTSVIWRWSAPTAT